MQALDWIVVGGYAALALLAGVLLARRAGQSVEEYFLSGRSLPWWITGTSMVATSFAADTPLVVTGWVRDAGIWKNWAWWCFALSGVPQVFLFARWWRRGELMTKAELAELRYGGRGARALRLSLGLLHAGVTNTLVMCWVLLAAGKILDTLLGIDRTTALAVSAALALAYSLAAGFWGVVLTDLVQFAMAMAGGLALVVIVWGAAGGAGALHEALAAGRLAPDTLAFLPRPGPGTPLDPAFWTSAVAAVCVYLGVSWWAVENVDASSIAVQRIAASKDERQGVLAMLWFTIAHYALRPWLWIPVALASLLLLPAREVIAPHAGVVLAADAEAVVLAPEGPGAGAPPTRLALAAPGDEGWRPLPLVAAGARVEAGAPLARTDGERAYVAMMRRFLPPGLLGLVVASLLAAFMSTIDTHVNLAASFFVNDVWRRFLRPGASAAHHVLVARVASAAALLVAALLASVAGSISELFLFFLAFLGGVGPVYVLRWLWWRVRASTEIAAMLASAATTSALKVLQLRGVRFPDTPLSPDGALGAEGRLVVVAAVSLAVTLAALALARAPDPRSLVPFYRRVRPLGAWGPVRALCPDVAPPRELGSVLTGSLGGLAATYGAMLGAGWLVLGRRDAALVALAVAALGALAVARAVRRLCPRPRA